MLSENPNKWGDDTDETRQHQMKSSSIGNDESIRKTLALLSASDDTSRFAGLTVLKTLLDSNEELRKDPEIMVQFWAAISARFLDRLLRAGASGKKNKQEAESMAELAVGVLHAFVRLVPMVIQDDNKLAGRGDGLMAALAWSPTQSTPQILQILVTLASTSKGCLALLDTKSWPRLLEAFPDQSLVLDVVKHTFLTAAPQIEQPLFWDKLDGTISTLLFSIGSAIDSSQFFESLNSILTASPERDTTQSPTWLSSVVELLQKASLNRQAAFAAKSRQALVPLTATLFHLYPSEVSRLIFNGDAEVESSESKPVSFLFVKLLLIDIRSTIPSLLTILNSPEYPITSVRLAGCYDIVSSFVAFLVQSLGDEDEDEDEDEDDEDRISRPSASSPLSPSLLLQLRVDISEVMSITIENLRDRFDASIAGAAGLDSAGLDSAARLHSAGPSNPPLAIAWDSSAASMADDPLTLSQLRTLALWLREDDNEALRKEAAGIMDVFLYLYASDGSLDFRSPVLIALEGTITVPEGVEAFLRAEGWDTLAKDLRKLLAIPFPTIGSLHGTEIVRVLLGIVEADETGPAKEEWMEVVRMLAATKPSKQADSLELVTAVAQLAVEIIVRSPRGVRKRNQKAVDDLSTWSLEMSRSTTGEVVDELQEVVLALEDLGVGGV